MELKFIGTGSGKTSLVRNHSSLLLGKDKSKILIDCGDGISRALMNCNVEFNQIDVIIFTHYHADHFSGISSLITQMKLYNRKSELKIFTHKNLIEPLKQFINSTYLFEKALGFDLQLIGYEFGNNYRIGDNFSFTAKQNSHIRNKYEVNSIPNERFVSASILFAIGDEKIIYTSDISSRADLFLFEPIKLKIYITETTHIDRDWVHGIVTYYHPEQIYLTHISDEDAPKIENYLQNQSFPESTKVDMAEDGHSVTLF